MSGQVRWGNDLLRVGIGWDEDHAPYLAGVETGDTQLLMPPGRPLIEILTVAQGHALANDRLVHTEVGVRARYLDHSERRTQLGAGCGSELIVTVGDDQAGLRAELHLFLADGAAALRSWVDVTNVGTESVALRSVASWASYLGGHPEAGAELSGWTVHRAVSDWLGEGRWTSEPIGPLRFPQLHEDLTGHHPRGAFAVASSGTWSTGRQLPVAAISSAEPEISWAWQVEHNGGWRWEIGQDTGSGYLALAGPTDDDHQWLKILHPGQTFGSVPAAITVASTFTAAVAKLTGYRRALRRPHPDNTALSVVFNDYMNTLNGDPTAAKLAPLISAAADVGAEVFCIDAGWYDDSGDWWDSVGSWRPSRTRFPDGLGAVLDQIRDRGMVPGLWLEPEVVGVRSPIAAELPAEAFLQRGGQRVVEQGRYHLDLRHPAARVHLDEVVDRLVLFYGVGYFKLDYNINPGAGTDHDADSPGAGLLDHNRAHLDWLDGVLDRHPKLILENCSSGAMRADFALLSRLQLQSTSDQQDFLSYPPITAAAPVAMLPEQAASWAYPQPGMTPEQTAFCLVTGLLGRFFLSGHLNEMAESQRALVREAVALARQLKAALPLSLPFWPLGLPGWDDPRVALGLDCGAEVYLAVWDRTPAAAEIELDLSAWRSSEPDTTGTQIEQIYPVDLPVWPSSFDAARQVAVVHSCAGTVGARIFRVALDRAHGNTPAHTHANTHANTHASTHSSTAS